jgi:hypothetical protein
VARIAVDAGTLVTKVASASTDPVTEPRFRIEATGPGDRLRVLSAALAGARPNDAESGQEIWLAIPDAWLDGSEAGGRRQEDYRHFVEDELRLAGDLRWVGQLAAVAALAASRSGFTDDGCYLVCDVGGRGVRVGVCEVTGRAVRQLAVYDTPGGGWADFDAAVRTALSASSDAGLDGWYQSALAQERRAKVVLARVKDAPEFRDARAYSLQGAYREYELSAGQASDCFAATADRIRTGVTAVLSASGPVAPAAAVLTGGLAWFPEAATIVADAARVVPVVLGPGAAVHGALLIAGRLASPVPPGLPSVTIPMHRISTGRLEDASVTLPWTAQFAALGDDPLILDRPELTLDVAGRPMVARLSGLVPGRYRIGVRPTWRGSGLLVLRPDSAVAGSDVHVIPLDALETA